MNLPDTFASAPLQMVVIGQLLLYCYVTNAEDADRSFPIYQPLLCFAVGLAGVIDEASLVPLVLCINDFMSTAEPSLMTVALPQLLMRACISKSASTADAAACFHSC